MKMKKYKCPFCNSETVLSNSSNEQIEPSDYSCKKCKKHFSVEYMKAYWEGHTVGYIKGHEKGLRDSMRLEK